MRIAVMQPYFYPYAGYFQLMAAVDLFVLFDCVQFPRRGRVHRTQVPGPSGETEWLTLPLLHQKVSTPIRSLEFSKNARMELDSRLDRLPWLHQCPVEIQHEIRQVLYGQLGSAPRFLEKNLRMTCSLLGLSTKICRSSELEIDPDLRGADRVIQIAKRLNATHYLNAPGGRDLYRQQDFDNEGIKLEFLGNYRGPFRHLLYSLFTEYPSTIRHDVDAYTIDTTE